MGATKKDFMHDRCINYSDDDLLTDLYSQQQQL